MKFSKNEMAAIFKLGKMMVTADGKIEDVEVLAIATELARFGVPENHVDEIEKLGDKMAPAELLAEVAAMDAEQKRYVAAYLGGILVCDGDIDDAEVKLWTLVSEMCDLPRMNIVQAVEYLKNM